MHPDQKKYSLFTTAPVRLRLLLFGEIPLLTHLHPGAVLGDGFLTRLSKTKFTPPSKTVCVYKALLTLPIQALCLPALRPPYITALIHSMQTILLIPIPLITTLLTMFRL